MRARKTDFLVLIQRLVDSKWVDVGYVSANTYDDANEMQFALQRYATVGYRFGVEKRRKYEGDNIISLDERRNAL